MALNVPGPSFDAPWMEMFSGYLGWGLATLLAVTVVVTLMGLGLWGWGKIAGSSSSQQSGIIGAALSIIAGAVITIAGSVIMWATTLGPEWANF